MSRIQFDWEVESQPVERFAGVDPHARRRRRNLLLLAALICALLAAFALGILLLRERALEVERQVAQLLQDTVKAEVASLRLGDLNSFLQIQDATDSDWISQQRLQFKHYGDLKAEGAIDLRGAILAVEIEGERARVLVQEDIKDLPFVRLWFYRRRGASWRHVAPDYSFWGEARVLESATVRVSYRAADHEFALQLRDALEDWIKRGCDLLDCGEVTSVSAEVAPDAAEAVAWIDEEAARLLIRSPYTDIARADWPLDGRLRLLISRMVAERLASAQAGNFDAAEQNDATFLWRAAIAWLSETFTRLESGGALMRTLALNYGDEKVAELLRRLSPASEISILSEVIGESLASAELDWSDFVEWRLTLEDALINAHEEDAWLSLLDTSDERARLAAYDRFAQNASPQAHEVIDQLVWSTPDGSPQLRATLRVNSGEDATETIVLFNLIDGVWKRAA